ncbi:MAG: hypothetical protein ACXWDO_10840 [Bacteroidia bacterium]
MKKIILIIILTVFALPNLVSAQRGQMRGGGHEQGPGPREEVEKIRKNVYARVLILTDEEAQKFWPVFGKMQQEMEGIRKEMNREKKSIRDNYATLTDAELDKKMENIFTLEQKVLDVKKKYYPEFKKVLPMKKVALLQRAEREFKKELLGKIRQQPEEEE